MALPHVVTALLDKRAELAGQIEHTETQLRQLVIDLDHVDATLRLYEPDIELDEIRPKPMVPRHVAFKGEIARVVLGMLRTAKVPKSSWDITMHVMAERGLNTADKRLVKLVNKRVGSCLRHHRAAGRLASAPGPDKFLLWRLARQ